MCACVSALVSPAMDTGWHCPDILGKIHSDSGQLISYINVRFTVKSHRINPHFKVMVDKDRQLIIICIPSS